MASTYKEFYLKVSLYEKLDLISRKLQVPGG